jgi:hypothetical protein
LSISGAKGGDAEHVTTLIAHLEFPLPLPNNTYIQHHQITLHVPNPITIKDHQYQPSLKK